jgi:magnesium transporter
MDTKFFIYFSEILGHQVRDERNRRLGIVSDIALKINGEIYPKSAALIVKRGVFLSSYASIPWENVKEIGEVLRVKIFREDISYSRERIKEDFSLSRDILDQQIVDINNRKVVRVNDVHLLKVENNLYLAHVDVGSRGLVRRLGWTQVFDSIIRMISPHSYFLTQEKFISWKNAQLLNLGRVKNVLRLDVSQQKLSQIPATELADIMEDLDIFAKKNLFRTLDSNLQRKVFADLSVPEKVEMIEQLDQKEIVALLENIPADEAVDLLANLPKRKMRQLLKVMETKTSKKLSKLLGFSKNSAGGLMTTEYLSLPQQSTVSDAIQKVKESTHLPTNIYYLYVVDDQGQLVGFTSVRNFINAPAQDPIIQHLEPNKISVHTDDGLEQVALLLEKYKYSVIPVLNKENVLQGVITIDDVMEELISLAWTKYKEKL